jgi:hypothetical protein
VKDKVGPRPDAGASQDDCNPSGGNRWRPRRNSTHRISVNQRGKRDRGDAAVAGALFHGWRGDREQGVCERGVRGGAREVPGEAQGRCAAGAREGGFGARRSEHGLRRDAAATGGGGGSTRPGRCKPGLFRRINRAHCRR